MDKKEIEQQVIANYKRDENMMIMVFAQWCINNDLEPREIYARAYPNQKIDPSFEKTLELTVSKEESEHIPTETVLNVLSLFENHDLAVVVSEETERMKKIDKNR